MFKLTIFDKISLILVIIGALNWGLLGLTNYDIVTLIFGDPINVIGRIIYLFIAAAGIDIILLILKVKKYSIKAS